ncbi:hypothetical protein CBM2606_A90166 [Cupriavidus taiwanensis]|nr:hypothetical protein CBM2606_A90166 [Cupriavidus taiwanensis]
MRSRHVQGSDGKREHGHCHRSAVPFGAGVAKSRCWKAIPTHAAQPLPGLTDPLPKRLFST